MSEDSEIIKEFLVESHENLDQLDRDFVALEHDPTARERLAAIFRTIHTIKGTSGFMGFHHLETVTHAGEHLLSRLRDVKLTLDEEITSELLRMVDAVRAMLADIEAQGTDGDDSHAELVARLNQLASRASSPPLPIAALAPGSAPSGASPAAVASEPPAPASTTGSAVAARVAGHLTPTVVTFGGGEQQAVPPPLSPAAAPPSFRRAAPEPASTVTAPPEAGSGQDSYSNVSDSSVRVDVGLLDKLMNLVGELVLARNQIVQHANVLRDAAFQNTTQRLNIITSELQEGVMKTRMQPIGTIWGKFPRVVRDLARTCKKQVQIEMLGEGTELDRTIIEAIKDPLTHLVRNSVDHGIEAPELRATRGKAPTGKLTLRAFHEGGQVNIEISDDGAGIDPERIRQHAVKRGLMSSEHARALTDREVLNVIFEPGFSTAERVTNVSGRGVGMDVVKTNIEKIGGSIDIQSRVGHGTKFKIKIPLTLAIIPALVITSADERFAIPQVSLLELVRLEGPQIAAQLEDIHGTPVYRLRGNLLPLVYLSEALNLTDGKRPEPEVINIVVVRADDRDFGLVVDGVNDTEEIVVKPLGRELKGITVFAGATIMGDGGVALILDVLGLAQRTGVIPEVRDRGLVERTKQATAHEECEPLLLFRVAQKGRIAMPLSRVARLEEFQADAIEFMGGSPVIQYRGEILPLIDLRQVLGGQHAPSTSGPLQIVVYSEDGRSIGLVVEHIIDIVDEAIGVTHRAGQPGIAAAAVIQGKVTELLDAHGIVEATHPGFFDAGRAA